MRPLRDESNFYRLPDLRRFVPYANHTQPGRQKPVEEVFVSAAGLCLVKRYHLAGGGLKRHSKRKIPSSAAYLKPPQLLPRMKSKASTTF